MSLQYKFFSIPLQHESGPETELNNFLRSVNTITIHKDLVCQDSRFYWAIAVEYVTGTKKEGKSVHKNESGKKVDYKEVLSPEDFTIYAKLRDWRKETAAREAVQLYNVFMNDQLAVMVQKRVISKAGLKEIEGIGDARIEKYGEAVLAILKEAFSQQKKKQE